MTCITYLNGVMMADRLSVVDNSNVPIIVDATKLFVSKKGDLAMAKSSTIITDDDAQQMMDLVRPLIAKGERDIPIKLFDSVFGSKEGMNPYALFVMSSEHIYTTLNSACYPLTRHNKDMSYPVIDGSGYAYMLIALNNGLSLDDAYAFVSRNDWHVGKVVNKITQSELTPIAEEQNNVDANNPQ